MNALIYARRNIYFNAQTPISGAFNELRYPFVIKPLLSLDDVRIKSTVQYKPTQSVGTVMLQIATSYRLDVKRKTVLAVAQTDADAKTFATVKLNPFLSRIPTLVDTVKPGRNSMTLSHWLWANHELLITGPGENAQNSTSCCYLHCDEDHLWCVFYPGAFKAMEDRMGARFDRHAFHVTTAADAGTEIDLRFNESSCDEWHVRCIACDMLFQPLWTDAARETYNGTEIFHYTESQSEAETLDSLIFICPHCGKDFKDGPRIRAEMDEGADYVTMNPTANPQFKSFRYNAFAPRWRPHRDLLAIYLSAIHSAKLGNLKPYENWVKKQEARTWTGEFPLLGASDRNRDYKKSDIEIIDENKVRTCSIDRQQGKDGTGFHLWCLIDEWERDGKSRRVEYRQLSSWAEAFKMKEDFGVKNKDTGVDFGDQVGRDVFAACALYQWYAMKSGDEIEFAHTIVQKNKTLLSIGKPFSPARPEDPMSGKPMQKDGRYRHGAVPQGCCLSILWSKPSIYPLLYALKNGTAERYYGIASDFNQVFVDQLHSYIPALDVDKKTNTTRKIVWQKVKSEDHSFVCGAQSLALAIRAGFYPMANIEDSRIAVIN